MTDGHRTRDAAARSETDELIGMLAEGKPLLHPLDGDPTADWMEGRGPRVYTCLLCGEKFPPGLYDTECPSLLRRALDLALAGEREAREVLDRILNYYLSPGAIRRHVERGDPWPEIYHPAFVAAIGDAAKLREAWVARTAADGEER